MTGWVVDSDALPLTTTGAALLVDCVHNLQIQSSVTAVRWLLFHIYISTIIIPPVYGSQLYHREPPKDKKYPYVVGGFGCLELVFYGIRELA